MACLNAVHRKLPEGNTGGLQVQRRGKHAARGHHTHMADVYRVSMGFSGKGPPGCLRDPQVAREDIENPVSGKHNMSGASNHALLVCFLCPETSCIAVRPLVPLCLNPLLASGFHILKMLFPKLDLRPPTLLPPLITPTSIDSWDQCMHPTRNQASANTITSNPTHLAKIS